MEHILSLSYGKDSLACLGAIEELGLPLDRIVHAEVWATDTIPADLPPMVEFKKKADEIIMQRFGIKVERVRAKKSYEDLFYTKWGEKSNHAGEIYGFPIIGSNACTSQLKTNLLDKINKDSIRYIGIAVDEPNRFHNLTGQNKSPLIEAGWTEQDCFEWCEANDLLSPIYTTTTRGGCWFCHNQSIQQLRTLRKNYPEYWKIMLKWDTDSPVTFKSDGHTIHDFDKRFSLEDKGVVPCDRKFRWKMLEAVQK